MKDSKLLRGYVYVIASAVIFGLMPLMTKVIYADGANTMTVVFLRNMMALPLLALIAHRQFGSLRLPKGSLPGIALIAVLGCCATPYLLFVSYRYISSGTATVLHFIYPATVVVGSALFLKTKVRKWEVISVVLCVLGICLFSTPGEPMDWRGSLSALASGVAYAAYVLLLCARKEDGVSGMLLGFYVMAISGIVMGAVCLLMGQFRPPLTIKGWAMCLVFAVTVSVGAIVLFQQGTRLIGGQRASVLSTLEPITGIAVGALVFHEKITLPIAVGSVLVLAASILIAVTEKKN